MQPQTLNSSETTTVSADGATPTGKTFPLWKRLTFAAVTLLLALALMILVGEVVLRAIGWPATGYYLNGVGPLDLLPPQQPNGRYPASCDGEIRTFEFTHPWKTNSYGFRDRELVPKQPGEYRIGLMGDSMVAGLGVNRNERFMELWFENLKGMPEHVTVWNLGISGTGTCQMVPSLEKLAEIYELDEVILALFSGNELGDNDVWQRNQMLQDKIERGEAERIVTNTPAWRVWLRRNSRVATYMWVHVVRYVAMKSTPQESFREQFTRLWPITKGGLDRFKAVVADRPFTLWYLPAQFEWDDERWGVIKANAGQTSMDRHVMRDAMMTWAQENDVEFLDLTPVLAGLPLPEVKYRVDGHWNARGHQHVAAALRNNPRASHLQRQTMNTDADASDSETLSQ